jgi:hypothetical protein
MSMDVGGSKLELFQTRDTSFSIVQPKKPGRHPRYYEELKKQSDEPQQTDEGNCGSCLGNDNNCMIF